MVGLLQWRMRCCAVGPMAIREFEETLLVISGPLKMRVMTFVAVRMAQGWSLHRPWDRLLGLYQYLLLRQSWVW
jgi:hypothetical protein